MDRWVCKRCFASNEGDVSACSACGWPRGEVPPPDDTLAPVPGAVPASGPPPPAPWWRPLLRYWWIVAIIVVGGYAFIGYLGQAQRDANGSITSAGSVKLADLRVGDCFDSPGTGAVSEVTGRPCTAEHEYELYVVASDDVDDTYPDDAGMAAFLSSACIPPFTTYVGLDYQGSQLEILPVTPTQDGWSRGDRRFFCALYDPGQSRLTGSLRGSAR